MHQSDSIESWPIKGPRPRGDDETSDRESGEALLHSPKDRAELLMIVDLERNDLSRVCHSGSVEVLELAGLKSYPAVHHLVARVRAGRPHGNLELGTLCVLEQRQPAGRSIDEAAVFEVSLERFADIDLATRGWGVL